MVDAVCSRTFTMTRANKNLVSILEWTCRIFRGLLVKLWSVLSKHLAVLTKDMLQKLRSKPSSSEDLEEYHSGRRLPKSETHHRSQNSYCRCGSLAREARTLKVAWTTLSSTPTALNRNTVRGVYTVSRIHHSRWYVCRLAYKIPTLKVALVDHTPSFSPGNLLILLFSQSSRSCNSIQLSKSCQRQTWGSHLRSQTIVLFIDIHSPPIFADAQLRFLGHLLHLSIMSFVSERRGRCKNKWTYKYIRLSCKLVSSMKVKHRRHSFRFTHSSALIGCFATGTVVCNRTYLQRWWRWKGGRREGKGGYGASSYIMRPDCSDKS